MTPGPAERERAVRYALDVAGVDTLIPLAKAIDKYISGEEDKKPECDCDDDCDIDVLDFLEDWVNVGLLRSTTARITGNNVPYGAQYRKVYWIEPPPQSEDYDRIKKEDSYVAVDCAANVSSESPSYPNDDRVLFWRDHGNGTPRTLVLNAWAVHAPNIEVYTAGGTTRVDGKVVV